MAPNKASALTIALASVAVTVAAACHSQPPRQAEPSAAEKLPEASPSASVAGASANEGFKLPADTPRGSRPKPRDPDDGIPPPDDVAGPPVDALVSATGLASKRLQEGTGAQHPSAKDKVTVHYTGWTADGKMFDSSVVRGQPADFPLSAVIKGWTEGVQLMVVGERRRFWIPAALAYGAQPRAGAPSGQLTFDVELLGITVTPPPPTVPSDVAAAPGSAKRTSSGLRYRVLRTGTGATSPNAKSKVSVVYTGWTTDGKMFDSSTTQGKPLSFPLDAVIPGWSEGVRLMHQGDVYRFWIPGKLAYGDKPSRPGVPSGTLVFDIELVEFE